jgi:hypothetical protein
MSKLLTTTLFIIQMNKLLYSADTARDAFFSASHAWDTNAVKKSSDYYGGDEDKDY